MAHHITEPTEYFPHLESRDLHFVQEIKALIQDHLYSGARDHSFQNALVEYYIRTNSQHAMDILCRVREPLDKPLLDKLNDCMKMGAKLQSLTLLSHIVRRQPTWLYKIVQTNLFASLLQCLKTSDDCPVIMCGLLTITTLLPMIPSLIGPSLKDIFEIFTKFAGWNLQRPGHVPDIFQLHLQAAVYALFHRLYGMFPWNFLEFLRIHYAGKSEEFNATILPMFERVRLHPQLILGSEKFETEAVRWRKMEVHDVLTECSRVSLDVTECTRDSLSAYNISVTSDSGRMSSSMTNQASRKTSSPFDTIRTSDDLRQRQSFHSKHQKVPLEPASAMGPQDLSSVLWSPSVLCGLATPPSSRPGSPGGSLLDASFNSSLQLISTTNTPTPVTTPLTTPRDSPHMAHLVDDVGTSGSSEGTNVGRSNSASKLKSKVPPSLKNLPHAHKTVSAPSTPGYAERKSVPPSPARKHSGAGIAKCFNFETETGRGKLQTRSMQTRAQRSREPSGESSEGQRSEEEDHKRSLVSMKDLPDVIEGLAGNRLATRPEDEQEINSEVSALVTTSSSTLVDNDQLQKRRRDMSEGRSKGTLPEVNPEISLPFKVDFMLSEIPCEVLRGQLLQKKEELLAEAEMLGDVDESEITEKLQRFCWITMQNDSGAESGDQEKSQPIPVPRQEGSNHCEVCSSSGKSIEVVQVTEGNTPLSNTLEGGFTPIRDQSAESSKSVRTTSEQGTYSMGSQVAAADTFSYAHLLPYALTQSWPLKVGMMDMNLDHSQTSTAMSTPMTGSRASSVMGGVMSSLIHFSPNELLDRHIQLGDSVHTKELSMLPLTSQMSVNWTHFGGAAPVDEVNILKSQVVFLHNQVLYERHKREVHAERNRRLLGKTHKAKACHELNIAMKDQMKLQEHKIEELKQKVELVKKENFLLEQNLEKKGGHYEDMIRKLEKDNKELRECNQELQKLLVEHKGEVDQAKKNVQNISSELFITRKELQNAEVELATTKRLKDEITWLNKELLLIGEVNQKLKEKVAEEQIGVRSSEEQALIENTMKKELRALKETFSEKMVQLNAAKTRITELEAALTNKDVAISEQKRFLETVKSLSKGRIEAVESKYHSQKKINQRLESTILKLTKQLQELTGKDIFKPRQYQRTNSEQIADTLRQNEGTEAGAKLARGGNWRASWHYPEWRSGQNTPTKSRNPSRNSISPVESMNQSSESSLENSPGPYHKSEEGVEDSVSDSCKQQVYPSQDKKENYHTPSDMSHSSQVDRVSSASRINFSQSSPFQRVRSSHSDPSGTGSRLGSAKQGDGEESKSWSPSGGPGLQIGLTKEKRGSGTPSSLRDDTRVSKVGGSEEDQTFHIGEGNVTSVLSLNERQEVRGDKES